MKKTLSLVALLFVTNLAISQSKVAHVDPQRLIDTLANTETGKLIQNKMMDRQNKFLKERDEIIQQFEDKKMKLEANRASYSPSRIKMEEQDLNQSGNTSQLVLKELEDSLQFQMMKDQTPIQDLIDEAVTKVSERKKIDLVLNSAELNGYKTVMYSAKGLDITDEVLVEVIKLEKEKLKK